MTSRTLAAIALAGVLTGAGCQDQDTEREPVSAPPPAEEVATGQEDQAEANVIELRAVGLRFEGPGEAPAGWTTIRFDNQSGMIHFAVIERLPEGVTIEDQAREVVPPFQAGMDSIIAGDMDGAMAAFAALPAWFGDVVFLGGPGLLSGGGVAESTVYLAPGRYTIECYVKTNGVFHSVNPVPGELGMIHELIVSGESNEAPEPEADAVLSISSAGFQITGGALRAGTNTIRADFVDQSVYSNFVGHDAHIVRLDEDTDPDALAAWMDWTTPHGLETPAPAVFHGGINEMPAGEHGYFTVELAPGDYAFIAEVPDPRSHGLYLPFSVEE